MGFQPVCAVTPAPRRSYAPPGPRNVCSTGEYNLPTPSPFSLSGTSSTFAAPPSPFISGKLADAAPGGDAASTTDPANPLLTLPTEDNLLAVEIDGVPVIALIDTGAHISVMSAQLRSRLRKVLTPALSHVRVAGGGTSAVAGMCTARVSIAGHPVTVMFFVLDKCPHDVILGRDFLSDHSALIDCSTGLLQLELPRSSEDHAPPFLHLHSDEHVRLPPQAATYVPLSSSMPVPDGDYVVAPVLDVLLTRNVALPHTIVSIQQNHVSLPFLNFAFHTQVLPQGMTVATVCPVSDFHISAFTFSQKALYDSRHRDLQFSPGSLVLLWSPSRRVGLSEKLLFPYTGPYHVVRQVTPVTYEISQAAPSPTYHLDTGKTDIVHVSRLKPSHRPRTTSP
ncbi:uncharacterized protein LOC144164731 [Haemaphysalis longicornis]